MNQIDVRGRVAVVTGGVSGIGLAIARRLLAGGATLSVWDRDGDALATVAPQLGGAFAATVDVRDYAQVERGRDATLTALGRIDILVTSAGITGPNVPVADYPLDGWRDVLDINLTGTFHCMRAVVPPMRSAGYGRIVALHLRDYHNGKQVPLGAGSFPLAEVAATLKHLEWKGWVHNEEEREDGTKLGLTVMEPAFEALQKAFPA